MKTLATWGVLAVMGLLVLAALAPQLALLADALLPVMVVLTIAAVLLRLVWFHTRKW